MSPQTKWNRKHKEFMRKYKREYQQTHRKQIDAKQRKRLKEQRYIYRLYKEGRLKLVK